MVAARFAEALALHLSDSSPILVGGLSMPCYQSRPGPKGIYALAMAVLVAAPLRPVVPPLFGQAAPEARTVVSRYFKAMQVASETAPRKTQRIEGRAEMDGFPGALQFTLLRRFPHDFVYSTRTASGIEIARGAVGDSIWSRDARGVLTFLPASSAPSIRAVESIGTRAIDSVALSAARGAERVEFDGRPCFKLTLGDPKAGELSFFFEVASGLIAGSRQSTNPNTNPLVGVIELSYSDYVDYGFGPIARRTVQQIGRQTTILTIDKVRYNTERDDAFLMPRPGRH